MVAISWFIYKETEWRKECSTRFLQSHGIAESTPLEKVIPHLFKEKINFRGSNRPNFHVTDIYSLKNFYINVVAFLSSPFHCCPAITSLLNSFPAFFYLFFSSFHLCFLHFSCFRALSPKLNVFWKFWDKCDASRQHIVLTTFLCCPDLAAVITWDERRKAGKCNLKSFYSHK